MKIECVIQREEPVIVPISNETYKFEPDEKGRKVAEVWIEDHIEAFLAVSHLYREVRDEAPVPVAKAPSLVHQSDEPVYGPVRPVQAAPVAQPVKRGPGRPRKVQPVL